MTPTALRLPCIHFEEVLLEICFNIQILFELECFGHFHAKQQMFAS